VARVTAVDGEVAVPQSASQVVGTAIVAVRHLDVMLFCPTVFLRRVESRDDRVESENLPVRPGFT
jgi:hypothetical protein